MEIREITTYHKDAPFTGYGIWIVSEMKYRKAQLLHPVALTELILSEYEFVSSSGNCLWPFNNTGSSFSFDRFLLHFKERIKFFINNGRTIPVQSVAKALAEFEGTTVKETMTYLGSLTSSEYNKPVSTLFTKANRSYVVSSSTEISKYRGRQLQILEVLKENEPASIYQLTHLVQGRLKTKLNEGRVVTYFINKLASQGVIEIVG